MNGKRISLALAVGTLLFVGAGCTADQQVSTGLTPENPSQQAPAMVDTGVRANAAAKVEIPDSVDASVDAILKDGSDETDAQKSMESDAADADSDNASAKAFGTASYDTETK